MAFVDGAASSVSSRRDPHHFIRAKLNAGEILAPQFGCIKRFVPAKHWELGASFRRLSADQWFVGSQVRESAAPFGQPLFLGINSLDATITYGVTDGLSVTLTVPFSRGTHSRFYADGKRHTVEAAGLGDTSGVANVWLRRPSAESSGNVGARLRLEEQQRQQRRGRQLLPRRRLGDEKPGRSVNPTRGRGSRDDFPVAGVPQNSARRIRLSPRLVPPDAARKDRHRFSTDGRPAIRA